ncbi:hypothetical protein IE81DRAFT_325099 [Ceraceosorus guamensis]|uniref:NAD-dependent epimerase/dehydratase domain-containing protein n=1 Tax=Ceraceosorus guamensis TaxID=1522189 RepID=A0A316VVF2_9BASI|nr:hypothetical protein IE81DRAFT_325099 [Ceraceosorus guamensis]PWN40918.1 hypothetical protein IE81DRAFT_325099 [Ceraceosorus guamensis]
MADAIPAPSTGKTAIIFGATGAVGTPLLETLLQSPTFDKIHSFQRRATDGPPNPKLITHTVDFDKLVAKDEEEVKRVKEIAADAVFITLGTTRGAAGSAQAFEKIDKDYVLAAARAAASPEKASSNKVVYCSSQMANSGSRFLYTRSKGETEEGLASAGYSETILFRPGFLAQAQRPKTRPLEVVYGALTGKVLSRFSDGAEIPVPILARAMRFAGEAGSSDLTAKGVGSPPVEAFKRPAGSAVTVLTNGEALRLGKSLL